MSTFTFEERLYGALASARDRATRARELGEEAARECALVVTKLEEACMWNDAARARMRPPLPPLGLEWRP